MLSLCDAALTATTSQEVLLLGHKWFTHNEEIIETSENDDNRERHTKNSVKTPEAFSGGIKYWNPLKIGT